MRNVSTVAQLWFGEWLISKTVKSFALSHWISCSHSSLISIREMHFHFPFWLDFTWLDFAPLKCPIWSCISTSAQFCLPVPLRLPDTSQLMSLQKKRIRGEKWDGGGASMLNCCIVTFPEKSPTKGSAHSRHERPSLTLHPKTSEILNHLLNSLFSSSFILCSCLGGTESGEME